MPADHGCKPGDGGCVRFPFWTGTEGGGIALTLTTSPSLSFPLTISLGHPHDVNLAGANYFSSVTISLPFGGTAAASLVSRGRDADIFSFTGGVGTGNYTSSGFWQDNNTGSGVGQPGGCDQTNGCGASYNITVTLN